MLHEQDPQSPHPNIMKIIRNHDFQDGRGKLVKIFSARDDQIHSFTVHDAYVAISGANVFRGLHRQSKPKGQSKFITLIEGSIVFFSLEASCNENSILSLARLNADNHEMPNCAVTDRSSFTGYYTETNKTIVSALSDAPYFPEFEEVINPTKLIQIVADKETASKIIISEKDSSGLEPPPLEKIQAVWLNNA